MSAPPVRWVKALVVVTGSCAVILVIVAITMMSGSDGSGELNESARNPTTTSDTEVCDRDEATLVWAEIEPIIERMDDANKRAGSTSRIALSPVIGEMQATRRDLNALDLPSCADYAVDLTAKYMDAAIDANLAFLSDDPDATVERLLDDAVQAQGDATAEIAKIVVLAEKRD